MSRRNATGREEKGAKSLKNNKNAVRKTSIFSLKKRVTTAESFMLCGLNADITFS